MKKGNHLDVEEAKEYVEEYCRPLPESEAQAKEAAWVLYQELQKCRAENGEKEEEEPEEEVEEEKSKPKRKEVEAAPATDTKLPPQAKQGKKSYKQFIQDQMKVIGMAGMIAMSTAVYAQSQAVYVQGAIVYKVVEKELPILGYLRDLLTGSVSFSVSDVIHNSTTSYQNATAKAAVDATKATVEKAIAKVEKAAEQKVEESIAETTAVDPSSPKVKSLLEEGKKITDKHDALLQTPPSIESSVPPVINPPATTNTNP